MMRIGQPSVGRLKQAFADVSDGFLPSMDMNLQATLHELLTFVRNHVVVLFLVPVAFTAFYGAKINQAAISDIRNTGSGWRETSRIAYMIFLERYSKRHLPAIIIFFGVPALALVLIVLPYLISIFQPNI